MKFSRKNTNPFAGLILALMLPGHLLGEAAQ
jgi:hypothetical protein